MPKLSSSELRGALRRSVVPVLIVLTTCWLLLRGGGLQEEKTAKDSRDFRLGAAIEELWFTSDEALVSTSHEHGLLVLRKWGIVADRLSGPQEVPIDLLGQVQATAGHPKPLTLTSSHRVMPTTSADALSGMPYALSEDADLVAWAWGGWLNVAPTNDLSRAWRVDLKNEIPVVALAIPGPDLALIELEGGSVEIWNYKRHKIGSAATSLQGSWALAGKGSNLYFFSHSLGVINHLRTLRLNRLDQEIYNLERDDLSASLLGRNTAFVGYLDGSVEVWSNDSSLLDSLPTLPTSKPVRALALDGERRLLVGGDFEGIFIHENDDFRQLIKCRPVSHLAARDDLLAYGSGNNITIARLGQRIGLTPAGGLILAIASTVMTLYQLWLWIRFGHK